jgi:predicted RNA binding protein YcfA (HicA-like mRNA interferase family)
VSLRQPWITAAQPLRALRRDGRDHHHQTGSHLYLKHETKPGMVTVARHAGVIIKPKTLAAILEQAELTTDQLRNLL